MVSTDPKDGSCVSRHSQVSCVRCVTASQTTEPACCCCPAIRAQSGASSAQEALHSSRSHQHSLRLFLPQAGSSGRSPELECRKKKEERNRIATLKPAKRNRFASKKKKKKEPNCHPEASSEGRKGHLAASVRFDYLCI